MLRRLFISLLVSFLLFSCERPDHCIPSPDITGIHVQLDIERLDEAFFEAEDPMEIRSLISRHPAFAEMFLSRSQYPDDSILSHRFYRLLQDPEIRKLWEETQETFGDLSGLREEFTNAFRRIKYYYPEFTPPRIQVVFTGLAHDMYISDSVLIIGLDYYLGEEASYRPVEVPEYILNRYRKENIVPNSMLLMSERFNHIDPSDQSLIADMIYYGKAHYFARQMLPCVPDSVFLGYSPEDMRVINSGDEIIWANFIENELLFETSHFIKDKFLSERPKTFEIGQNCPGRIGRWVGWEIVRAYMERNGEISIPNLMAQSDARKIFEMSRYKPGK